MGTDPDKHAVFRLYRAMPVIGMRSVPSRHCEFIGKGRILAWFRGLATPDINAVHLTPSANPRGYVGKTAPGDELKSLRNESSVTMGCF